MPEIYKKCDAKNESFTKLSESFEMSFFFAFFPLSAAVHRCSTKQVFLKNPQNSQENTCAGVSF